MVWPLHTLVLRKVKVDRQQDAVVLGVVLGAVNQRHAHFCGFLMQVGFVLHHVLNHGAMHPSQALIQPAVLLQDVD